MDKSSFKSDLQTHAHLGQQTNMSIATETTMSCHNEQTDTSLDSTNEEEAATCLQFDFVPKYNKQLCFLQTSITFHGFPGMHG